MPKGTKMQVGNGHFSAEELHGFAAGEVDPARRAVMAEHVGACGRCRASLEGIERVQGVFTEMAADDLDDFTWRRIHKQVREELQQDAASPRRPGFRWVNAGARAAMAAGIAVAIAGTLVWAWPEPAPQAPATSLARGVDPGAPQLPEISTGNTPFELRLLSGVALELSSHARLRVIRETEPQVSLELDAGEVAIRVMDSPGASPGTLELRTPQFRVASEAADFSVGYWASESFVSVRKGEVRVAGQAYGDEVVIGSGQKHVVRAGQTAVCEGAGCPGVESSDAPSVDRSHTVKREGTKPAPAGRPTGTGRVRARAAADPHAPTSPAVAGQDGVYRGDRLGGAPRSGSVTTIEVVAPRDDTLRSLWLKASQSFYEHRDTEAAIGFARQVVDQGGARGEVKLAHSLLCEAYLSTSRPAPAARSCEAALALETQQEARRRAHGRLARIYAERLDDCDRAIRHYGEAIVFGLDTPFDEQARIGRIRCALRTGKLDLARSDVATLRSRSRLSRRSELDALEKKLRGVGPKPAEPKASNHEQ